MTFPRLVLAIATSFALSVAVLPTQSAIAADKPPTKAEQAAAKKAESKKAALEAAKKAAAKKAAQAKRGKNAKASNVVVAAPPEFRPNVPADLTKSPEARDAVAFAKMIDRQINATLTAEGITPSPICTDEEFVRRAYLDLTGVIPTADAAEKFLADASPNKRAELIDELLADPNYGRRLADQWVPKLFPKDSNNRFVLKEPLADWLKGEFNKNTRWDEFVYELVTATGTVEDKPAVTYYLANRSVDKITDTVTQHFLGVQLQCAQCHNHPFTGWKQEEYWAMATFFSRVSPDRPKNKNQGGDNSKIGVTETAGKTRQKDFFPEAAMDVSAKFLGGDTPKLDPAHSYRGVLAGWMVQGDNPYFARAMVNRTWARLFGRGFVNPVDDMHPDNPPSHPELLDEMSAAFAGSGFDLKHLTRAICLTDAYQRSAIATAGNEDDVYYFSHMAMKVMTPEQLHDSLFQVLGQDNDPKAKKQQKNRGGNSRDRFVEFFLAGNDEANPTEYEAGIPQALRMMNSRYAGNPGVARKIAGNAKSPAESVEKLFLASLSRRPTEAETARMTEYIGQSENSATGYADVLWVLLNTSEFTLVR